MHVGRPLSRQRRIRDKRNACHAVQPYGEAYERSSIFGSRREFPYWFSGSAEASFERPQVETSVTLSDETAADIHFANRVDRCNIQDCSKVAIAVSAGLRSSHIQEK